jgi:integrase
MRLHLTDLAVRKLRPSKKGQTTYWDSSTPGFGIRCSARSKSYVVMFGSNRRLKTIGRYPDVSLADARRAAKQHLAAPPVDALIKPQHQYQTVLNEYLAECSKRLRPSTLEGYQLYLTAIPFDGPVDKLERKAILQAIREYSPRAATQNYAFTTFKVFLNWMVREQYLDSNPLEGEKRPNAPKTRDRVLARAEVTTVLQHTLGSRDRFNDIVSLLLLTGQRRGEIAGLRWEEIDNGWLSLSPERTKNKHRHELPLPNLALKLLETMNGGTTHAFGTQENDVPFSGWARAQRRLLRETELPKFTLHDLRRSFATLHAELGTPIHVTERLLNHRSGSISGVAAVYNRHNYRQEMQDAVQEYEALITGLIS